jgi:hypothetical protein
MASVLAGGNDGQEEQAHSGGGEYRGPMGKADRKAHQIAKAGVLARKELQDIGKQVEALKRQLQKTTKRLKRALS